MAALEEKSGDHIRDSEWQFITVVKIVHLINEHLDLWVVLMKKSDDL